MKRLKELSGYRFRRLLTVANLVLFLLGVVTIALVVGYFAARAPIRQLVDATKTRSYSLSDATQQLLKELSGDWTIAMVMTQDSVDQQLQRQIDEVLQRFDEGSSNLNVVQIDPADPVSLQQFELLLTDLQLLYSDLVLSYDEALDAGTAAFTQLQSFAQLEVRRLQKMLEVVPPEDPGRRALEQRVAMLSLLAQEGGQVIDAVDMARRSDPAQPIPDYVTARSILAEALSRWSNQLLAMAREFRRWSDNKEASGQLRTVAAEARRDYQEQAQGLVAAADPLKTLEPLELSTIGQQLQSEQVAVIIGPDRAAAIASSQLFPKFNLSQAQDGGITYDQRFRGEQQIAATMRAMLVEKLPTVVVVHGEDESLLRRDEQRRDLVGLAQTLKVNRFGCEEWLVSKEPRPQFPEDQPVVWLVQPPPPDPAPQLSDQQEALINAVHELIAEGEPVLLSCYPTVRHRYGQRDPWSDLLTEFGLQVDTSRVVYETVRVSDAEQGVLRGQSLHELRSPHPIAQAVNGQQLYFDLPVAIKAMSDVERPLDGTNTVVTIDAGSDRWLEEEWPYAFKPDFQPEQQESLIEDQPVVVAVQRPHPIESGIQRVVAVGSGPWLMTKVASDAVEDASGRTTLRYPGNYELALASIAWLTGQEVLMASNPTGRHVSRLTGITDPVRWRWFWMTMITVPIGCLLLSLAVWGVRRF
jgi:hypothetical protein